MKKVTLMTKGSIYKNILLFSIPIFIGQLFQQLYNIVDSLIVGNFVGKEALSAVTSTSALNFLFVGFVSGIFMGAGVLISKYFGSNDKDSLSKSIHTSVAFSILCGILLTIVGVIFTPYILKLMGTPDDVIKDSTTYIQIIFAGSIFTCGYNCANGIYQAVGDTKNPLKYLITASIINIVLDLLFVGVFNMGVAGAALATIIGQAVSMLWAYIYLFRTNEIYRVDLKQVKFHSGFITDIIIYGVPAGIQNSVISIANIVVQSNINAFGSDAMAGSGIYSRIEGIVFIPVTSFTFALTTFISQNLGAKEYERTKKGARFGILSSMVLAQGLGLIFFLLSPFLTSLFNQDPIVIEHGVQRATIQTLFFFLMSYSHCASAVLRGAGKSIIPMITMLVCWCVIRVIYIESAMYFLNDIRVVYWAYPITWTLSSTVLFIILKFTNWTNQKESITQV